MQARIVPFKGNQCIIMSLYGNGVISAWGIRCLFNDNR